MWCCCAINYWKKSNNEGALTSIALGVSSWILCENLNTQMQVHDKELLIQPQMVGLMMAVIGMIIGSLFFHHIKDSKKLNR